MRAAIQDGGPRPGHPLYAGGHYLAADDDAFKALHALLHEHEVEVVMAGDTHDLELYLERYRTGGERMMHHVVNGHCRGHREDRLSHAALEVAPDGRRPDEPVETVVPMRARPAAMSPRH